MTAFLARLVARLAYLQEWKARLLQSSNVNWAEVSYVKHMIQLTTDHIEHIKDLIAGGWF